MYFLDVKRPEHEPAIAKAAALVGKQELYEDGTARLKQLWKKRWGKS